MTPEISLESEAYMKIIAGKPIEISPDIVTLALGKRCKLINKTTKTYMFYRLHSAIGEYGYWVK
ncbi:hypothetical protein LC607_18115 [Nostoc sp. CHAB 5824]|nr:hypothetical protein [Nostoc sp. CHAB 5824]